jgi:hypothetical protein
MKASVKQLLPESEINEPTTGDTLNLKFNYLSSLVRKLDEKSALAISRKDLMDSFDQLTWLAKDNIDTVEFDALVRLGLIKKIDEAQVDALIDIAKTNKIEHPYPLLRKLSELINGPASKLTSA